MRVREKKGRDLCGHDADWSQPKGEPHQISCFFLRAASGSSEAGLLGVTCTHSWILGRISFPFKFLLTAVVWMTTQTHAKIYFSLVRMDRKGTFKGDMWLSLGKYETNSLVDQWTSELTSPLSWILVETLQGLQTFSCEHQCPVSHSHSPYQHPRHSLSPHLILGILP